MEMYKHLYKQSASLLTTLMTFHMHVMQSSYLSPKTHSYQTLDFQFCFCCKFI